MKVLEVNPGFRVDGIVAMDVALPWLDDLNAKARQAMFFAQLIDRLGHIPGVRNVGATSGLPLMDGGLPDGGFLLLAPHEVPPTLQGLLAMFDQKERRGVADFCGSTAGYLQVLGIPAVRGPLFRRPAHSNP